MLGLAAHALTSPCLEAVIVPSSGARIASLVDRRRGVDWMWAPPGSDSRVRANRPGDDFATGPIVGVDECIPTVGACRAGGVEMPDHGEVWPLAFASEHDEAQCVTSIDLATVPLHFRRTASVQGPTLRLDYTARRAASHDGDITLPWLWSWHPLLVLPDEATLALEGVSGVPRFESGEGVLPDNPILQREVGADSPLRTLDLGGPGRSAKLFLDAVGEGSATISDACRDAAITIRWRGEALRGLGIWINRGGWNGYQHVAIEPCTAPVESADQVRSPVLGPGADEARWSLEVTVHGVRG